MTEIQDRELKSKLLSRRSLLKSGVSLAAVGSLAPAIYGLPDARAAAITPIKPAEFQFEAFWDGDRIGFHRITLKPMDNGWRTTVEIDMKVDLGLFGDITFKHDCTELWKNGRLVELSSKTDNDGERFSVSGQARGGEFALKGPGGPYLAPGDLLTTNSAWSVEVCKQKQLIDATHGGVIGVVAKSKGKTQVKVAGKAVTAERFSVMSSFIAGDLFYDPGGYWLGGEIERSGASIDYVLKG